MDFFLKDSELDLNINWDFLVNDINSTLVYNPYCKSDNYYQVFKCIIISLLIGKEVILLDSDFSDNELINLTGFAEFDGFTQLIEKKNALLLADKSDLIQKIKNTCDEWKITLFTSGTTGMPKKVCHNYKSITRFVKLDEINKDNIWGFAYNPTHMAGIQVFFQALLNGNGIVRLFGLMPISIFKDIDENRITHISATPTFYRMMLPSEDKFPSIIRITSGGEKFNEKTISQLSEIFPNARITNVYASTEAGTLFASENDVFSIKPELMHLIQVVNEELLIHNSLMGSSDLITQDWYNTGDVLEIITENPLKFRFVTRKSDIINVGGYKVNPLEVEEAILSVHGIKDVRVYSKSNSVLGNIICCDVVRDNNQISESSIRTLLQLKIQEYKIPRMIRFVNELSTTRTGKIKRD
ncbi:AMP-binding enzyme [Flavobacterium tiangeerense]|uniref:AMP-binding enzyme n=1 Tax=Flavobacterium tiangeerense TaxID=459471 RepID=A0ABY3FJJ0_9FLAO|nr:fatty acid--CoA ligase family protein [Flavobacterium tiangeerense]TWH99141.1 AMP-binding enzyme [Flavobacterium tiangeerense]